MDTLQESTHAQSTTEDGHNILARHTSSPGRSTCLTSDVLLENVIGFNAFPKQPDPANNAYTAVDETSDGPPTDRVKYIGDIFYNNWDGLYLNAASGQDTQIIDSYFESPSILRQTGYSTNEHGNGLAWW